MNPPPKIFDPRAKPAIIEIFGSPLERIQMAKLYLNVDGDIIGIIPGYNPADANQYVDIVIATGLDQVRNLVISNSDAVVAVGGGAGTLTEIGFAWSLKRLLIAYKIKGWSGKVADTKIDFRDRYPDISEDKVFGVSSESEVIEILDSMLPKYDKRFTRL